MFNPASFTGGEGGGLLLASFHVFILPDAERRFLKNSAEGQRLFTCRSRRLMKNLCRSLQINFTIPQKEEKKEKKIFLDVLPNTS